MSRTAQSNMNAHITKVTALKNQIIGKNKLDNKNDITELLRQMRIHYGRAIYDDETDKIIILKKGIDNLTDDDFIKLSTNASLLYVIHHHIRQCEKTVFGIKEKSLTGNVMSSDSDDIASLKKEIRETLANNNVATTNNKLTLANHSNVLASNNKLTLTNQSNIAANQFGGEINDGQRNRISATIKKNGDATEEISVRGMETETEFKPDFQSEYMLPNLNKNTRSDKLKTDNLTEYINNLTSSEAKHLETEYDKNMSRINDEQNEKKKFDVTRPTLVNYWADWCGYSIKFNEHWQKFKSIAAQKFPNLQVTELNVKNEQSLKDLAKKVGVKGFPTLVLFNNGQTYHKTAGNLTANDVEKFVQESLKE